MTRREVLAALTSLTSVAVLSADTTNKKYGRLTVQGHRAHQRVTGEILHVFVDGRDVTANCYEANDVEGYAYVYCRDRDHHRSLDAQGAIHIGEYDHGPCRMKLIGNVVFVPGEPI